VELQGKHPYILKHNERIPGASSLNVILSGREFAFNSSLILFERHHALAHLRKNERWELTRITFNDFSSYRAGNTLRLGYGRQAMYV
jgi:hypothetical protein